MIITSEPAFGSLLGEEESRESFLPPGQASKTGHFDVSYKYSLIIPAYNEANRIVPLLTKLKEIHSDFREIIIVCDGNDETAQIARSLLPTSTVLEYDHRLGKGGAVLEGFRQADGDVVGYVDADGAIDPSEILKVFRCVNDYTPVAIGSRWLKTSYIITRQPILRVILGRIYHYVAFAILGLVQKDIQCGLKAYKRETLNVIMQRLTLRNLSVDTAILYHCKLLGTRVAETPISWKDVNGSKFHPIETSLLMFGTLIGLRLAHSKHAGKIRETLKEGNEIVSSL